MNKNVEDYVRIYKDFIPLEICNQAISDFNNADWKKHHYNDPLSNESVTYDNDLSVTFCKTDACKFINDKVWYGVHKYICEDIKLDWFSSWSGYSEVRFNKYDPGTEMRQHCDHIHTLFDGSRRGVPILTILGALNNDYEGGEFIMFEDKQVLLPAGSIAIFPSNFLFPHVVKPVTSGVRYSYVSWTW